MDLAFHLCCSSFLEIWPWLKVVRGLEAGSGTEAHGHAVHNHQANDWLAHGDMKEKAQTTKQDLRVVTGKSYALPVIDIAGKERKALLQPYSSS